MLKRILAGKKWPIVILLLIGALILSINIDKPFWGHHDWNGVYWGQVAKNFFQNGPLFSKFGMYLNAGDFSNLNYNFHFFPFFTLIWASFFKIFGIANWVSRFMAILFSLGSVYAFYKIVEKSFGVKTAIITCLLWMATPMFIYFGKMPVHEIPLMFFVLLTFWFHFSNRFMLAVICCVGAMLITWPGFFLVPVLVLLNRRYLFLIPVAFGLFGLHLLHNRYVTGDYFGGGLKEIFMLRTASGNLGWYLWYVKTLASWAWTYYSLLVPISVLGLLINPNKVSLCFLLYAFIYPVVFRDSASRHDYLLIYFWPFFALSTALALRRWLLVLPVLILMLYLRWDYIVALQNSSLYKASVEIGKFIKPRTLSVDKILVVSADKSLPFDGWFAGYYSDRPVSYSTDFSASTSGYKVFYYFPGGEIRDGRVASSAGEKYIPQ